MIEANNLNLLKIKSTNLLDYLKEQNHYNKDRIMKKDHQ